MRPLKISIEGFGTYCKAVEIDFTKFGNSGLYLITGDTGSGKTTIFDAITFALYGEPSGSFRQSSMLRSTYADENTPTYVELEFLFRDKIYKVNRNPSYLRKAKRGDGLVSQDADAALYCPDGSVITKTQTVTNYITELLGLDRNQFMQIAMIAQGDFQKLLTSDTSDRQEIFRKIFKTDKYQQLQKNLSAQENELKNKCVVLRNSLTTFFSSAISDSEEFLELKEKDFFWDEKIEFLNKLILENEEEKFKKEKEHEKLKKKLEEYAVKISGIEDYKSAEKEENEILQIVENLEQKNSELLENKNKLENQKEEFSEKEKKLTLLKDSLKDYENYEQLLIMNDRLSEKNNELNAEFEKLNARISKGENLINETEKLIKELASAKESCLLLKAEKEKLILKEKNIQEIIELENHRKFLEDELLKNQDELKEIIKESEALQKKYMDAYNNFLNAQAGILASTLEENSPCPVCGSLIHPSPAKKSENVLSQNELELLKKEAEDSSNLSTEKSQACAVLITKIDNVKNQIQEKKSEAKMQDEEKTVFDFLEEVQNEISICQNQLVENNTKVEKCSELETQLPKYKSLSEELKKQRDDKKEEIIKIESEVLNNEKNINELKKELEFSSKKDAEDFIEKLDSEINEFNSALEKCSTEYLSNKEELVQKQTSLKEIKKRLEIHFDFDAEEILNQAQTLEEEEKNLQENLTQLYHQIETNNSVYKNLRENTSKLKKLESEYSMIQKLSATANGKIGQGKDRIMLETYVQMTYFDRIIAHANKRFLIMSGGQYELVRKKSSDDARIISGLELNVIDHYSGSERSVKSLSGGESFEASLALALGLSDEIACTAGGIKIDTMFIDEGFGTLDTDTIQKAYDALVLVSEENRLVGIISHVDFLKEKIDRQIVVKKELDKGSHVKIVL